MSATQGGNSMGTTHQLSDVTRALTNEILLAATRRLREIRIAPPPHGDKLQIGSIGACPVFIVAGEDGVSPGQAVIEPGLDEAFGDVEVASEAPTSDAFDVSLATYVAKARGEEGFETLSEWAKLRYLGKCLMDGTWSACRDSMVGERKPLDHSGYVECPKDPKDWPMLRREYQAIVFHSLDGADGCGWGLDSERPTPTDYGPAVAAKIAEAQSAAPTSEPPALPELDATAIDTSVPLRDPEPALPWAPVEPDVEVVEDSVAVSEVPSLDVSPMLAWLEARDEQRAEAPVPSRVGTAVTIPRLAGLSPHEDARNEDARNEDAEVEDSD